MRANVLPALTTALLALAACTDGGIDPRTNSGSHWLLACDSEADCADGLGCACGVCTSPCDAPGTPCTGETSDALCVLVESTPTGIACESVSVEAICLPECSADEDCPGAEGAQACEEGWCVPRAVAEPVDAGQDVALADAGVLPIDAARDTDDDAEPQDTSEDIADAEDTAPDTPRDIDAVERDVPSGDDVEATDGGPIELDAVRVDAGSDSGAASTCVPAYYASGWSTVHSAGLNPRGLPSGVTDVEAIALAPSLSDLALVVRYRDTETCADAGTPFATTQLESLVYSPEGPAFGTTSLVDFPESGCDELARVLGTAAIVDDPDSATPQMLAVTQFAGVPLGLRQFGLTTDGPVDWQISAALSVITEGTWLSGRYTGVAASGADGLDYALVSANDDSGVSRIGVIKRGAGSTTWAAEADALFPDADDGALGARAGARSPSMALVDDCEVLIYDATVQDDASPDDVDMTTHVRTRRIGEAWSEPAALELPLTVSSGQATLRVLRAVGGRLYMVESRAETRLLQAYAR